MAEEIKFEINMAQAVALRFAEPKRFKSKFGGRDRCMFSTTDGQIFYTDPEVADLIAEANIQPGERFAIGRFTKGPNLQGVEWRIQRLTGKTPAISPSPAPVTTAAPVVEIRPTAQSKADPSNATESNDTVSWLNYNTALLTGCLCAAVDALSNAKRYAASKDVSFDFNEEDARCCALTLFINASKSTYAGVRA